MLDATDPRPDERTANGRPSVAPHLDMILDGGLAGWLDEQRSDGLSYESMMLRLAVDHGIEVSRESIRRWQQKLDAARDAGEVVQW